MQQTANWLQEDMHKVQADFVRWYRSGPWETMPRYWQDAATIAAANLRRPEHVYVLVDLIAEYQQQQP